MHGSEYPHARKTNSFAIASLIAGILSMTGIGPLGIVAVITGKMAVRQIERSGDGGYTAAKIGLALGWVAIVMMIFLLIFILMTLSGGPVIVGGN